MTSPRILLVDDNADLLETLFELFSMAGYEPVTCLTLERAVELLQTSDFAFVLTNLQSANAEEIAERLSRLLEAAAPARVGVLSGWKVPPEWLPRAISFALLKPVAPEVLLASVAEYAAARRARPEDESLVRAYFSALTAKDWDGLAALCTENVVYLLPGDRPPWSKRVEGRDAFREFSRQTFLQFPDAVFEVPAVYALAPPYCVARFRSEWTHDGSRRALPGAVLFGIAAGKIASIGVRLATGALDERDAR